jgi:pimeloyl-ACP methyl ester carboxylesterase
MAEYLDVWYHSDDGLRLYARDYPCSNSAGAAAPTMLCMHGLTRNSADFHDFACHMRDRFRVIAVDQRGRGRSDYDRETANYTPLTYVRDMFILLAQLDLDSVVLVGTSMGGMMAFMMTAMQPDRVSGLVINDIGPDIDPVGLARIKSYVGRSAPVGDWDEAVAQAKEINGIAFPDFSDQQWLDFTRGIYHEENGRPVLSYDPAISQPMSDEQSGAVPPDLWPLFEACTGKPMLVVRGEHSDILAAESLDRMRGLHPALQVAVVPNRGHAPTLSEPVALTAIDAFVQRL